MIQESGQFLPIPLLLHGKEPSYIIQETFTKASKLRPRLPAKFH